MNINIITTIMATLPQDLSIVSVQVSLAADKDSKLSYTTIINNKT